MKLDANKLDQLREAKGWTKTNLSIQSGVSDFTLNSIRKGKDVREATAQAIADALGVPLGDILAKEEIVEESKETVKESKETVKEVVEAPELPDAITQTLEAVKDYGEHEYQRGRSEMCDLFLKAVREAIDRWTEVNDEVNEEDE